jgi:cyclopropane-fatty-acyl-phospholipid synthase
VSPAGAPARSIGHAVLSRVSQGRIEVAEGGGRRMFGDPRSDLSASVEVRDPVAWRLLLRGSTGFGEGYVRGAWHSEDLVELTRIAARNMPALDRVRRRWHPVLGRGQRLAGLVPRNSRRGARANISAHYDLGNELFAAFLDERLMYSCAYFPHPEATLEEAQLAKLERICRQLELGPDDHLLEIGTGWGGMAIHAAAEHGCRVTTTTISREQHAYATARVRELGLADRVTVLDRDYRDLTGRYSKLVSIEMIEAVGWQYFPLFFEKCSSLLAADGLMLLQAIVIDDDAYEVEKASKSFANTHIFPGGCLPSERVIGDLVAARTDMRRHWADDITPHYAETLRLWRERFDRAAPDLARRGYDERFRRLWTFYLSFCEGGFRERRIRDVQLVFAKPGHRARRPAGTLADAGRGEPALA